MIWEHVVVITRNASRYLALFRAAFVLEIRGAEERVLLAC
jgi:hypothetical protein